MTGPRQHVFLVGGRGTRLGSITTACPKPMVEVGGRPFLEHLFERACAADAEHILLLCGYLADSICERYHGRLWGKARINCITEEKPLGTGGALAAAACHLDEIFWLANGDSLFEFDRASFADWLPDGDWLAKLALAPRTNVGEAGVVFRREDRIVHFQERGSPGPGLINAGVYIMRREAIDLVSTTPCSLERELFPRLGELDLLWGRPYDGYFIDIGTPAQLTRARQEIRK